MPARSAGCSPARCRGGNAGNWPAAPASGETSGPNPQRVLPQPIPSRQCSRLPRDVNPPSRRPSRSACARVLPSWRPRYRHRRGCHAWPPRHGCRCRPDAKRSTSLVPGPRRTPEHGPTRLLAYGSTFTHHPGPSRTRASCYQRPGRVRPHGRHHYSRVGSHPLIGCPLACGHSALTVHSRYHATADEALADWQAGVGAPAADGTVFALSTAPGCWTI